MKVLLASQDADLCRLCQEIIRELDATIWDFSIGMTEIADADLSIWDYSQGLKITQRETSTPSKHIFLVDRNDLNEFRQTFPHVDAAILLKPVTRVALTAFLGQVIASRGTSDTRSLRADRDEMLQCLIEANLKLQEYDQDRTNFLARGMHDFRAPLTAISGYCGLLLSESLGSISEEQREVLQRMQRSAKRLSRMSSAMFQLGIGRHVKRHLELRNHDLQECLNQALHEINPLSEGKNISITVDLDLESRFLYFDDGQMEQLLVNLLDNACRFTPKHGEIEIRGYPFFWDRRVLRSVRESGLDRRSRQMHMPNGYRIDIRNSGSPIPHQHLRSIFEEYTSYGGGRDRSGGGLGLAICRMIATLHHGTIWAENTENGPRFSFVLPLHVQPPAGDVQNGSHENEYLAEVL
jgi:signal transduction histidine kinase